jgi:transposase-like protein
MQPNSKRRVHGAEFKAQVLAECEEPGASVAAVALAHGLNVNRKRSSIYALAGAVDVAEAFRPRLS